MQFSAPFVQLVLIALSVAVSGTPVAPTSNVLTFQEMKHWIATTDAELTFIGTPINELSTEAAQSITVTYCSSRSQNVCGGSCTVYTGGSACLAAPGTACLSATGDVGFCDHSGCTGSCNEYASCGTILNNGFCYTPGTKSIIVPPS
ncbi:hypothetical protein NM688_g2254 [Phlebia brevispora]|uniref:Uncharacterized protein n=1 Tax=Phlebia brevispora TaxID=194682 RepID=A0ACC1T9T7_9APHY|nr:hypothetical protein NM688_g2254 [Phlebia brevispora]